MGRAIRIAGICTLTKEDWAEIYYAVADKISSDVVNGDKTWINHLSSILDKIGEDGEDAFNSTDELANAHANLKSTNHALLQAGKKTLALLENITSEDFSKGKDKSARNALESAIRIAEGSN